MNCKHVQELLPLYVGRDLEEKRAQLVKAHVESCAECASSADEYRETRQLLQQFAPPAFSEAVYTGIRQRVLREIGRESTAPALPQLVASLFRPRIRWAVATALMLAVSVLAFYFVANRSNDRSQVADGSHAGSKGNQPVVSPSPSSEENKGPHSASPGASTGQNRSADTTITGPVDPTHQSQRRKSSWAAVDRTGSVAVNTPDPRSITKGSSESDNLGEPEAIPARSPAASEKSLRVEMQTKDPNIRIIWFSHQRTKQDSPSESSKGI